jgi:non-heme chloroperoxidase
MRQTLSSRYPGGPHGLAVTHKDQLNADLLEFAKG